MGDLSSRIENAIQSQNKTEAIALIREFLKVEEHTPSSRFIASEYLRRLFEYSLALEALGCEKEPAPLSSLPPDEIKIFVQHARLRNMLGASAWALRFFSTLPLEKRTEHADLIAPVLLSNYQFEEALPLLLPRAEELSEKATYQKRLQAVSVCDALIGLNRFSDALELSEKILNYSKEPLIHGILHEVMGSAYLRSRDFTRAKEEFARSLSFYPEKPSGLDFGYLKKCLGALAVETGIYDEAERHFEEAWTFLYRPGMKPEVWLDLLFWEGLLEFKRDKTPFPTPWRQLMIYPQPVSFFRNEIEKHTAIPNPIVLEHGPSSSARTCFDFGTNTAYRNDGLKLGHGGFAKINLDIPEIFYATLVAASPYGVPEYRLSDHLWSGEAWASEIILRKRMDQAVFRTRNDLKIEFVRDSFHFRLLPSSDLSLVSIKKRTPPDLPGVIFLERQAFRPFLRGDVETFFGVSRGIAYELINLWTDGKRVEKINRRQFQVIP